MKVRTVVNPEMPGKAPNLAAAQERQDVAAREIHERVSRRAATLAAPSPEVVHEPVPPREDLESIEFTLPNGMDVVFGPPKGVSLTYRIISMMGGVDTGLAHQRVLRALLCVRMLSAIPVSVNNEIEANALANKIGDQGMELLNYYLNEYWPPLRKAELPLLKKNQRV